MTDCNEQDNEDFKRAFYLEWKEKQTYDPRDHGVELSKDDFSRVLNEDFREMFRGYWTTFDLAHNPQMAMRFCDEVRHKHLWFDLPDQVIMVRLTAGCFEKDT
jgi:hypothetical protein